MFKVPLYSNPIVVSLHSGKKNQGPLLIHFLFIYSFIHLFIYSFIHLFIYSFIHLFIYSFIHLFIYSFIHLFIYSFIHLFIYSFIHLFIYSFIHLFIYSFIHLFIYSFIHLFIYSFIHLFIYSFIHLFIYSFIHLFILDSTLSFSTHIKSVMSKTRNGIGLLRCLSKYLPRHTLNELYKLYVGPHLGYGDVIYHIPAKVCEFSQNIILPNVMERLESVQYSDAFAVTGLWRGTSCEKLYTELGWESLSSRR